MLFITSPASGAGFRLAGIDQRLAEPLELEDLLVREVHNPDNALIVIDEQLISGIDDARLKEIETTWPGVIVMLPSPAPPDEREDYALRLIRQAVGYHVRLRL